MNVGDPDGFGRYGVLDEDADDLFCHECGRRFTHLGVHAWRGHELTADEYRQAHGLARSRGLVARGVDRVLVAGMDEVGRGALAGPVVVGVCAAWLPAEGEIPAVRGSKALTDRRRRALVPEIRAWAAGVALGEAGPAEIDALGITAALGLAGRRAWAALCAAVGQEPVALVLDGRDDWLSRSDPDAGPAPAPRPLPPVPTMLVRAEDRCATVAAASIVAKVARDDVVIALDAAHPGYGWAGNKGYGSAAHRAALAERGASGQHRRSWNLGLPGAPAEAPPTLFD